MSASGFASSMPLMNSPRKPRNNRPMRENIRVRPVRAGGEDQHRLVAGVAGGTTEDVLTQADMIVLLVDHREYTQIDWSGVSKPVLDTRGVLSS